jgi:hypothetical protein
LDWKSRVVFTLASLSLACAPIQVTTDVNPEARFPLYQTYFAMPSETAISGDKEDSLTTAQLIQSTIDTELQRKGYRLVDTESTDLIVGFTLESEENTRRVNAADPDTDFYVRRTFVANTLVISVVDSRTGDQIWQGTGETEVRVGGALVMDDQDDVLVRTVKKILAELPPAR